MAGPLMGAGLRNFSISGALPKGGPHKESVMGEYHDIVGPGGYVARIDERNEDPPRPLEVCRNDRLSKVEKVIESAKEARTIKIYAQKQGWKLNPELPGLVYGDDTPKKRGKK